MARWMAWPLVGMAKCLSLAASWPPSSSPARSCSSLDTAHPLVRRGDIERPGIAPAGFGNMTPMGNTLAHVIFGLVISLVHVGVFG